MIAENLKHMRQDVKPPRQCIHVKFICGPTGFFVEDLRADVQVMP